VDQPQHEGDVAEGADGAERQRQDCRAQFCVGACCRDELVSQLSVSQLVSSLVSQYSLTHSVSLSNQKNVVCFID